MTIINIGNYTVQNHERINILFGKNGCGKSTIFKEMAQTLRSKKTGVVQYITPERGGVLLYQAGVEGNMQTPEWFDNVRYSNQFPQFKEQSVILYRDLKATMHTRLDTYIKNFGEPEGNIPRKDLIELSFDKHIKKINSLLDNIEIREDKSTFKIYTKGTDIHVSPAVISSGESELISLAIECLAYDAQCEYGKENILFLDEPDVHLHPDLQARLMYFLKELVEAKKFTIFIATHSTALIGALDNYEHVGFSFFTKKKINFDFSKPSEEYKNILPIFGAHPLSNIYCKIPIFLVEGDDDVWLWQKAIRTSGELRIFPCGVSGDGNMLSYEKKVNEIILSVYDAKDAIAYSLRDRDDKKEANFDSSTIPKVKRLILGCRCSENLLLSDDVLNFVDFNWDKLKNELDRWLENNSSHQKFKIMSDFKMNAFNRKQFPIKEITNIIAGILTDKPWQALVGQVIGELIKTNTFHVDAKDDDSLSSYLGAELVTVLLNASGKSTH